MKMSRKLREQVFNCTYMEHLVLSDSAYWRNAPDLYKMGLCVSIDCLHQRMYDEISACIRRAMRTSRNAFVTEVFSDICQAGRCVYTYSLKQEVMTALVPIRWMWFWNWVETGDLPDPSQFFRDLLSTTEGKEIVNGLLSKLAHPRVA
jgi:hypothetical protein